MTGKEYESPIERFMYAIRKGTTDFKIGKEAITEDDSFDIITVATQFHIDVIRTAHLVVYLKKLMKDRQGSIADVLRDIYYDAMIEHEKYFVVFTLGRNFKTSVSEMSKEELETFINPIVQKLDVSNLDIIMGYIYDIIEKEEPTAFAAYAIEKIIESDFKENDKVFAVFMYAII